MEDKRLSTAATLSDDDLLHRVRELAGRERDATVELVVHLAEVDNRKLYLGEGYGSLFAYCTGALRLAEHAAYNRLVAARVSRRFPEILDLLAEGSLNLATVRLLAPHLRSDNFDGVVAQAKGRSKRDVEALVARLAPQPDVPASVRKLPTRKQSAQLPTPPAPVPTVSPTLVGARDETAATSRALVSGDQREPSPAPTTLPASTSGQELPPAPATATTAMGPVRRAEVAPFAPERYRVQFSIGAATHEKLRQAQDLLRREIPDGDPGEIFDRALTLLLDEIARKKLALTTRSRPGQNGGTRSRRIPARVKRAVWLRDGGRCAFVATNGRRCTGHAYLEFHHLKPYAIGGEATVANISLRCRAHYAYEAELAFGPGGSVVREAPAGYVCRGRSHSRQEDGQTAMWKLAPGRVSTACGKRGTLASGGGLPGI